MIRRIGVALLVLGMVSLAPVSASDAVVTTDLPVQRLPSRDALVILRSMVAEARQWKVVDEHTVRVTAAPETVELAKVALDLAEHPSDLADNVPTREMGDGTVLACVRVQHAKLEDVMKALRKKAVRRLATNSAVPSVMVRDTPSQVSTAIEVVRHLEAP